MTTELRLHPAPGATDCADVVQQFLKLDHLGEHIAIRIYSAQLSVCRKRSSALVPVLSDFLVHEKAHLNVFAAELQRRGLPRCRGFELLGSMGSALGALTALLGEQAILACTAAVETVVLRHLNRQLAELRDHGDWVAVSAVESIIEDEESHRQVGAEGSGPLYRSVYALVAISTTCVIRLGLYL